jgi:ribonuclease HII
MYKIWIDEAGRWPWLWPVVACSLTFNPNNPLSKNFLKDLDDSKKISSKKREELYKNLIELSIWNNPQILFWVWIVDNYLIDEINIKQANKEAMRRSLVELLRKIDNSKIKSVVIDWNDNYKFEELEKAPLFIIWWDAKVKEIGAASIIAKVFRDNLMKTYSELYPSLWIETHKWYWTKKHRDNLQKKSDITWIHRLSYKPVKKILEQKEKVLLHICCWPDATVPIMDLKDKYEVVCFWYDPNIQPKKEYEKRYKQFVKVCEIEWVEYIKWEYDVANFFKEIEWLENTPERGEKCTHCYDMRLKRSALEAKKIWAKYRTSTLNTSPHKDLEKMFFLWDKYSLKENLDFLKIAFRKKKGFERSVEYTKKHNIYRQDYCGCIYSDTFPGGRVIKK